MSSPARPGVRAAGGARGGPAMIQVRALSPTTGSCCARRACAPLQDAPRQFGATLAEAGGDCARRSGAQLAERGFDGGDALVVGGHGRRGAGRASASWSATRASAPAPRARLRASGSPARCAGAASAGGCMTCLLEWARERDVVAVHLDVVVGNDPARSLYQRLGFVRRDLDPYSLRIDGEFVAQERLVLLLRARPSDEPAAAGRRARRPAAGRHLPPAGGRSPTTRTRPRWSTSRRAARPPTSRPGRCGRALAARLVSLRAQDARRAGGAGAARAARGGGRGPGGAERAAAWSWCWCGRTARATC